MKKYNNLFKPLTIKHMKLKNRVFMPPMGTNYANADGTFSEDHYSYYETRAKGGVGLITLENVCLDFPMGTNGTRQLRLDNDQYIPGMWEFNERMHAYGACTSVQINHAGASAYGLRLNGETPVSASNIPSKKGNPIPRALSVEEIKEIVKKYGEAASRAKRAGFDCVEIHAGHSYLLSQFLSPLYNDRTDEYGGSSFNRSRIIQEVVKIVRESVGPFFPISLRLSADELLSGGNTLEDSIENLNHFVDEIDIISVSAALNDNLQYQIDKMSLPDGWRAYMAKTIKEQFPNKVIIASGNIRDPKVAENLLEEGYSDLVAMGRGLIAEPFWVEKVQLGQEELLRKCISCNIGCADHRIKKSLPLRCTVNPDVIYENRHQKIELNHPLKMIVIGGGTTGLEAACTAAEMGVAVELFESKEYLGGLAHEIARFQDKKRIDDFTHYLRNRTKHLSNLRIHLNTSATIDHVDSIKPDLIVNATGAKPILPPILGLHHELNHKNRTVFSIFDILENMEQFQDFENKRIVVIGGGAVGLDVVEHYATNGSQSVKIVEMQDEIGKDLDLITRISMDEMMQECNVIQYPSTQLVEVKHDRFIVRSEGELVELEFDLGFVCLGMRADAQMINELEQYGLENDIHVKNLGDSKVARRIMEGTREARDIAKTLQTIDEIKTRKEAFQ